ncbi:MAG: calcium-translocating P-type ATPase, PMCA-type [Fusobacteriaceae bacterium]
MYYREELKIIFKRLKSCENGLTSEQVKKVREKTGYNELIEGEKKSIFNLFMESFKDPLVIILLIAAGIQVMSGHFIDSMIILIVLILNAVLNIIQTKKAEGSLRALKELSAPNAKVLRDGKKVTVPVREIVPGDIVILDAGDFVPADGRIIQAETLKISESALTGESEPVEKKEGILEGELPLGDRKNMVFSGTLTVYGRGVILVTGTGMESEIGKIAQLLSSADNSPTPLQKNLEKFTKKLGIGILGLSILIFIVLIVKGIFIQKDSDIWSMVLEAFMFSVAVAVAAIPEALSSIVTIVLSVGTNIMARKNAIIRKLPAVETLGATSIICTDKTGTLTQNRMTVVAYHIHGLENSQFNCRKEILSQEEKFLAVNILANDSTVENGREIGDPTELALINFAHKHGINTEEYRKVFPRIGELPFDSDRKIMSTLNKVGEKLVMFSKGAPDIMLSRCSHYLQGDKEMTMTSEIREIYREKNEEFSSNALRVIALSYKEMEKQNLALEDENDMVFLGLIAMIDPPRDEVYDAIKEAKAAGMKPIMITGDHKTTAAAIAREIGLMEIGEKAFTGQELDALKDVELDAQLEKISVYARVSPENKIRIVKAWQKKGKIVAMTGDGVNDAPALKQADIGIAMGSGTDVAKDAAAMILTDDNFASIVHAVETGRTVYINIKKAIVYLFTGNLGAILAIIFALFAGWNAPFTALQLLFINLINDSLPAIALGLEQSDRKIMESPPRNPKESLFTKEDYRTIFFRGCIIAAATITAQYIGGTKELLGISMAFTTLIFSRTLQTLPARSNERTLWDLGIKSNKYVIVAVAICFILYSIVQIPLFKNYFSIAENFTIKELGICLLLATISTATMEIRKKLY